MSLGYSERLEAHILDTARRNEEFNQLIAGTAPDELMGRDTDPIVSANRMRILVELGSEVLVRTNTAPINIFPEQVDTKELPVIKPE